jgi:hypothetical protein
VQPNGFFCLCVQFEVGGVIGTLSGFRLGGPPVRPIELAREPQATTASKFRITFLPQRQKKTMFPSNYEGESGQVSPCHCAMASSGGLDAVMECTPQGEGALSGNSELRRGLVHHCGRISHDRCEHPRKLLARRRRACSVQRTHS